jgi:signal peptidase I
VISAIDTDARRPNAVRAYWSQALRLADRASNVVCGLALALLAILLVAMAAGYRPVIDHSDSMRPAILAGDLLITRPEPATNIRTGDIVSFNDPVLDGRSVTHRVVGIHAAGRRIDFLTRGDANSVSEAWSAAQSSSVGKLVLRVPAVGEAIAWMADRWTRTILLTLAALLLSTALMRRIWKT